MSIDTKKIRNLIPVVTLVVAAGCGGCSPLPAPEEQGAFAVVTPVASADFDGGVPLPDSGQPGDEPIQRCAQSYGCPVYITLPPGLTHPGDIKVIEGNGQHVVRSHPTEDGRYFVLMENNVAGRAMIELQYHQQPIIQFVDVLPATDALLRCRWQGHAILLGKPMQPGQRMQPVRLPAQSTLDCDLTVVGNGLALDAIVVPAIDDRKVADMDETPRGYRLTTFDNGVVHFTYSRTYYHLVGPATGFTRTYEISVEELAPIPEGGIGGM